MQMSKIVKYKCKVNVRVVFSSFCAAYSGTGTFSVLVVNITLSILVLWWSVPWMGRMWK